MEILQLTKTKNHFSAMKNNVEVIDKFAAVDENSNIKRELGTLEGKMSVIFDKDFAISDEKLINL